MLSQYGHNPEDCVCKDCHTMLLSRIEELESERSAYISRIANAERGEFICRKCGLRKDDDYPKGDF